MIKLLIVDDEKGIADSLKDFFQHRGFSVKTANSGEDALAAVKTDRPDIVFLDIRMRGISGLDVLEKIKKMDKDIKVIMLTILEEEEVVSKAKKLGADEYITKPFRIDYLEEVVIKKVQELMKARGRIKPVVLVVDDEVDARNTIINFLEERFDCRFREARDGEEAVRFVKTSPCDVMLLDIKMPKKSGMTVIKEAKEINPDLDIMVISAWVSDEVAEEATKLGATDYAVKPMNLGAIALKFANILEKRGQKVSKI